MLNNLPTDKHEMILTAHNANHDCRFIQQCLQNVRPTVKGNRFVMVKASIIIQFIKIKIEMVIKDSYRLVPIALRECGECFKLDCHKENMLYEAFTYEKLSKGACCIQDAIDVLKAEDDKQQFLDNIENGIVC